jgi:two-component system sensor histidine kinase KdpD
MVMRERILVCIGEDSASSDRVRYAAQLANLLQVKWTALYIQNRSQSQLSERERALIEDCIRLAQQLGGQTATLPGAGSAKEILAYARQNNVAQIVVGHSRRSRWSATLLGSIPQDLVRIAGDITVHVIGAATNETETWPNRYRCWTSIKGIDLLPCLLSLGLVALVTALGDAVRPFVELTIITLLYVTAVLITAAAFGLIPSLLAAFISVFALDFFFLQPVYSLSIASPEDIISLLFFSIVAVVTSGLASRLREQMLLARGRAKTTADLYAFSRELAGIVTLDDLLKTTAHQVGSMLGSNIVILIGEGGQLTVRARHPGDVRFDESELAAVRLAWQKNRPEGRGPLTLPYSNWAFIPLSTARGTVGALAVSRSLPGPPIASDEQRLLNALAELAGVAIERLFLAEEIDQARLARESERLRSALLTSIAHDLRTPVTAVLGALSGLRGDYERFDSDTRNELLDIVQAETERLEQFIVGILDMTRLEERALEIRREPLDLGDVVGSALRRARRTLGRHTVKIDLALNLPMLQLDFVLFEQVLYNLFDNATKYSPPNSTIYVKGNHLDTAVVLSIIDEGTGIPDDDLERIFDKFYRAKTGDFDHGGTGLGLAICRGFVEALGGSIAASNRTDRSGAILTIKMPTEGERVTISTQ